MTDSLSEVFCHTKVHKKRSRNIIFNPYLRKLSRFWAKFSTNALVIDTYMSNIACTNTVIENGYQLRAGNTVFSES